MLKISKNLIDQITKEFLLIASMEGVDISEIEAKEANKLIAKTMTTQISSTAQDLARGKKTEIEFLNGYHTENVHNKFKQITNAKKIFIWHYGEVFDKKMIEDIKKYNYEDWTINETPYINPEKSSKWAEAKINERYEMYLRGEAAKKLKEEQERLAKEQAQNNPS